MVPLNSVSILNNFLYGLLIPQLVRIIPAYSMTRRVEIMHIQCAFVLKYSFWNIRAIIPFNKKVEKHIIAFDVSKLNFFIRAASTMHLVPATIFEFMKAACIWQRYCRYRILPWLPRRWLGNLARLNSLKRFHKWDRSKYCEEGSATYIFYNIYHIPFLQIM